MAKALDLTWRSSLSALDRDALHERLHALFDEFEPQAIHDRDDPEGWRVFFRGARQRDEALSALRASDDGRQLAITAVDVIDEDWARRSQANLTAIRVGRIVVAPPWDATSAEADLLVVIDPSTGFGTGHHETTRLCLSLLQSINLGGRRVIDVGTGSGVLAIAAAKLGASAVTAFDEDPEALRNARENVASNGVSDVVDVREANLASFGDEPAAVVVANITGAVIERHAARLAALVAPGGQLIASGFNVAEAGDVERAFTFAVERRLTEGDWAAVLLRSAG